MSAERGVPILANRRAGARSGAGRVEVLAAALQQHGFSPQIFGDLAELTAETQRLSEAGELHAVVSAGGDGTISFALNGLPPGTPLAVYPLGTENLLARHMGITQEPEEFCRMLSAGETTELDVGRANGRLFLIMAGCGFDAEVVRRFHAARSGNIHHLDYIKPIFEAVRNYRYPRLRVYCHEAAAGEFGEPIEARWAFVVNLPRYALGLGIAPDAAGDDGLLDVITFREGSLWSALWYLGGVLLGQHQQMSDCTAVRTRQIRIEAEEPVPYQLDGDPGGFLPLELEVLPHYARLFVPPKTQDR